MQISNGTLIIEGGGLNIIPATVASTPSGPVSGDPSLSLGLLVNWTSNTYFYSANGQTVQSSSGIPDHTYDTNNMLWQVFYAHRQIRLPAGSNRWGVLSRQNGVNSFDLYVAVSSENNTLGKFNSNVDVLIGDNAGNQNYTGNVLFQSSITTQVTIPANRYFLLGITGGPFYKNYRRTANNITVVNDSNAIVTAVNRIYAGNWPTGPTRGVPTQLGGNVSNYLEFTSNIYYSAFKFEVV